MHITRNYMRNYMRVCVYKGSTNYMACLEYSSVIATEMSSLPIEDTLTTPRNAAQHVFPWTPRDGRANGACQHHVLVITELFPLLRRIKLDSHVAANEIFAHRALGVGHAPLEAIFGFSLDESPNILSIPCGFQFQFRKTR
jgi:hypothetical protein